VGASISASQQESAALNINSASYRNQLLQVPIIVMVKVSFSFHKSA